MYLAIHLSGPSVDEIDAHRRECAYCRTEGACDLDAYKKNIQIAAELDATPVDENGSTVGSRTWHTQNGTHWKPKEKVVHTTDDL